MHGTIEDPIASIPSDCDEFLTVWGREPRVASAGKTRQILFSDHLAGCRKVKSSHSQEEPKSGGLEGFQWVGSVPHTPVKRCFDFLVALLALLAVSPLLLLVYLVLKLSEQGPAINFQRRVGQRGKLVPVFKFRTMVPGAEGVLQAYLDANPAAAKEWASIRKLTNDPRITPIGRFFRKSSIDGLPQLFNVLRGELSLVGLRPVIAGELDRYGLQAIHYLRHRPGITGLWQVSGRSKTTYEQRVNFDRTYSLQRNIWLELKILLLTVPAVLRPDGTA